MRKTRLLVLLLLIAGLLCACAAPKTPERIPTKIPAAAQKPTPPPKPNSAQEKPEPAPEQAPPVPQEPTIAPDPRVEATAAMMEELTAALSEQMAGLEGKWAVYAEDMSTSVTAIGEKNATCDDPMISASIVKIFIMAALYDRIAQGTLDEDAIYSDIYQMITISDNAATNRLIKVLGEGDALLGMERVNAYALSIGCTATSMHRLMLEDNGLQNYVSARDCAVLLRMIFEETCVDPESSQKMLAILKDQYWGDYIPKGPPQGTVIAHKGGDLTGLCHGDVGIVYAETGPYILCILCNEPPSDAEGKAAIAPLAALVDQYMSHRPIP